MQKRRICTLVALCLLLVTGLAAGAARAKVPPGAFVTRPVLTSSELSNLISSSATVRNRYARHFGVSGESVAAAISSLRMATIRRRTLHWVYFIIDRNRIISHMDFLEAGDRVLVDSTGKPVILMKCGNPLTKVLPKRIVSSKTAGKKLAAKKPAAAKPVAMKSTAMSQTLPAQEPIPTPVAQLAPPEPSDNPVETVPVPPTPPVEMAVLSESPIELPALAQSVASSRSSLGWLLPAIGVAGSINANSDNDTPSPVPEPSGIAAMLATLATGLGTMRLVRRRK